MKVPSDHPIHIHGKHIRDWQKRHLHNTPVHQTSYWEIRNDGRLYVLSGDSKFVADYIEAGLLKTLASHRLKLGTHLWTPESHREEVEFLHEWSKRNRPTHLTGELAKLADLPLAGVDLVEYRSDVGWMIANVTAWLPPEYCLNRTVQQTNMMIQGNAESRQRIWQMRNDCGKDNVECSFKLPDDVQPSPPNKPGKVEQFITLDMDYRLNDDVVLTGYQLRVLCLLLMGRSNKEIASELGISLNMVNEYKNKHLKKRLHLESVSGSALWDKAESLGITKMVTRYFVSTPIDLVTGKRREDWDDPGHAPTT